MAGFFAVDASCKAVVYLVVSHSSRLIGTTIVGMEAFQTPHQIAYGVARMDRGATREILDSLFNPFPTAASAENLSP